MIDNIISLQKISEINKKMKQDQLSKSFLKLPQSKKYPRLFRLKTTALVVLMLIAIVSIVDLSFFIYTRTNKQPQTNLSFVNEIITQTKMLNQSSHIGFMLKNMLQSYPKTYYQYAQKVSEGNGNQLNIDRLKNTIFKQKSDNLMFLFYIDFQGGSTVEEYIVGYFTEAGFPIPKSQDYNSSIDYYTFQGSNGIRSLIFSLQNPQYITFNGTENTDQYLNCKNYVLSQQNNYIEFFNILRKSLTTNQLRFYLSDNSHKCFYKVDNKGQLLDKINSIFGFDVESDRLILSRFQVYRLTNVAE